MKILVVGGGGREHALADKFRADSPGAALYAAPGNPGTAECGRNVPIGAEDVESLASFAEAEGIELTVVGPEGPLADGIAEVFRSRGLALFGPTREAARIETSKAFAKRLMRDCGVPTAGFEIFSDFAEASAHAATLDPPLVVKASGLAGGKGAIVCSGAEEAQGALRAMLIERRFGDAGEEVVIEEFMNGEELSLFYLTDGESSVPLVPSRDHKRRFEGDRGPNTGGMGAYAPVADGTPDLLERVRHEIVDPVLQGLAERGCPYRGFLYCGLMLTDEGPKVVEFNARMGDPEAQAVLPLTPADLTEPMLAVARGEALGDWTPGDPRGAALVTVVVSDGYPGPYPKGVPIDLPRDLEGPEVRLYHAGTALRDGRLETSGGRVFGVTGLGPDLATAAQRSRAAADRIRFRGAAWRADIGRSEIASASGRV